MRASALAAVTILALAPLTAHAAPVRAGIRFGVTDSPDQIAVGAHVAAGQIADRLQFFPSGTLGLGDNLTTVQLNADARVLLPLEGSAWKLYGGAGFGFVHYDPDGGEGVSGSGANFLFGAETPGRGHTFLVELRAGTGDLPDLAFLAGFTFR